MIFPVLFYHRGAHGAQNAFIDGINESPYTEPSWRGMACELENIGDCIVKPSQFGIDIFPAYVFLRRLDSDPEDAVMVKKIEGRPAEEGLALCREFLAMLQDEEGAPEADDEELAAFTAARAFPGRMKCATLSWEEMGAFLEEREG